MILGRNTQQWMGLITAILGYVGTLALLVAPDKAGPIGIILTGATGTLGVLIAFIANVYTTPISSPQLQVGTVVAATNTEGVVVGHVKVPVPEKAPEAPDVGEEEVG